MHDSSFWYQYSAVGPRGGTAPLAPPSDPPMTLYITTYSYIILHENTCGYKQKTTSTDDRERLISINWCC